MLPEFIKLLITCILLIILDIVWFSFSLDPIYRPTFLKIQGSPLDLRLSAGIVTWFLIAVGIRSFVVGGGSVGGSGGGSVGSNVSGSDTTAATLYKGALLGFIIYGVYNGTNYATLKDYPISTAIADTLWGTFAVATVSLITKNIF
jgi:uncharacterized membrane protein